MKGIEPLAAIFIVLIAIVLLALTASLVYSNLFAESLPATNITSGVFTANFAGSTDFRFPGELNVTTDLIVHGNRINASGNQLFLLPVDTGAGFAEVAGFVKDRTDDDVAHFFTSYNDSTQAHWIAMSSGANGDFGEIVTSNTKELRLTSGDGILPMSVAAPWTWFEGDIVLNNRIAPGSFIHNINISEGASIFLDAQDGNTRNITANSTCTLINNFESFYGICSSDPNTFMRLDDATQVFGSGVRELQFLATNVNITDVLERQQIVFDNDGMQLIPDQLDRALLIGNNDDTVTGSGAFVGAKLVHAADAGLTTPVVYNFSGFSTIIYPSFTANIDTIFDVTQSPLANYAMILANAFWTNDGSVNQGGFLTGFRSQPGFRIQPGTVTVADIYGFWSLPLVRQIAPGALTVEELSAYTTWRSVVFSPAALENGTFETLRHYHASNPGLEFSQELTGEDAVIQTQIGIDIDQMTRGSTQIAVRGANLQGVGNWSFQFSTADSYHVGNISVGTTAVPQSKLYVAGAVTPTINNTWDLGTADRKWANIHAVTSNIGDLQEDYTYNHAFSYAIGDLVCIDITGVNEIKPCESAADGTVLGVVGKLPYTTKDYKIITKLVSTEHKMIHPDDENLTEQEVLDGAELRIIKFNTTEVQEESVPVERIHDVIAVSVYGKHIAKVIGNINKGDLLISSNSRGIAISLTTYLDQNPNKLAQLGYLDGRILGSALASYNSATPGTILVFIGK